MHDIWNPWHGCVKISEGCRYCYMYTMDRYNGLSGAEIRRNKGGFDYPLQRDRTGAYRIRSGETVRVCMTSDFFLEEADPWRDEAWAIMRERRDVRFFLLTKRAHRIEACLPPDWGDGWEHVILNVTCENQRRADERLPILLSVPARHKGVMCAPFIGPVDLGDALATGQIEQVVCGGENYDGARPCHFDWVLSLREQCLCHHVTFAFIETGTCFIKDGRRYTIPDKTVQGQMAYRAGVNHQGRSAVYHFRDAYGDIPPERLHTPWFGDHCAECGNRIVCNGCSRCTRCTRQP